MEVQTPLGQSIPTLEPDQGLDLSWLSRKFRSDPEVKKQDHVEGLEEIFASFQEGLRIRWREDSNLTEASGRVCNLHR